MSELKAFAFSLGRYTEDGYPCVVAVDDEDNPRLAYDEKFYLKSEADKVIAELKEERDWLAKDRAQAYDDLEKRAQLNIKQEESIRHQKFKRCEAMAKWCRMHDEFTQLESERLGLPQRTLFLDYRRKAMWWNKWQKRWLELAEKFKEGE